MNLKLSIILGNNVYLGNELKRVYDKPTTI